MHSFYTVDRSGRLSKGLVIGLVKYDDITPNELQRHVDELFPSGFTNHGEQYFLKNTSVPTLVSPQVELLKIT